MKTWTIEYKYYGELSKKWLKGTYKSNIKTETKEAAIEKFKLRQPRAKVIIVYEKGKKKTTVTKPRTSPKDSQSYKGWKVEKHKFKTMQRDDLIFYTAKKSGRETLTAMRLQDLKTAIKREPSLNNFTGASKTPPK